MSSDSESQARQILKSAKLYRTAGRVAVLKVLLKAKRPLSQDQIAGVLGKSLVGVGLVHKAFVKDRAWHFELAHNCSESQCHPHFTCTNCGGTHCLIEMSIPKVKKRHKGFLIHRQQTRLEGLCPACAQKERKSRRAQGRRNRRIA